MTLQALDRTLINGVELEVRDRGSGEPVVFVHGAMSAPRSRHGQQTSDSARTSGCCPRARRLGSTRSSRESWPR